MSSLDFPILPLCSVSPSLNEFVSKASLPLLPWVEQYPFGVETAL